METKVQIVKLNNKNYFNWKYKMQLLLIKEKVWYTISKAKPTVTDKWTEDDQSAMALIGLNIEDNQLPHVRKTTEAWNALKTMHEKDTLVTKVTLMREMYETKMNEGEDIEIHLEKLETFFQKLEDVKENLSEHLKIALILSSLPKSWLGIITALEVRKDTELNLTLVNSKLIDEGMRRRNFSTVKEESVLKIERSKGRYEHKKKEGENSNSSNKSNVFCYFCKKRNHIMKDCRKFKEFTEKNYANMIEENENDEFVLSINEEKIYEIKAADNSREWTLDSGATSHISNDKELFSELVPINNKSVKLANGERVNIMGIGCCCVKFINEHEKTTILKLTNVLYVKDLKSNFISIKKLTNKGCEVRFYDQKADIQINGKIIATANIKNEMLLQLDQVNAVKEVLNKKDCIHYFHRVFGHRNVESIKRMLNEKLVTGIELKTNCNCQTECEICIKSKLTRKAFVKEKRKITKRILDLVHTDLCEMRTLTHSKLKYVLTFIDDYSRYTKIYLLREKSETKEKLMDFVNLMKNQFGIRPKKFNADRGVEYMHNELKSYLDHEGIEFQFTSPYTPQLNGVAERKNRSLVEMVRCMLNDAHLEKTFWAEAITTANCLQNRIITSATNKTPYEMYYKKRPQVKSLAVFRSRCYVKIPNHQRHKLENSAKEMILFGFDEHNSTIYRCYDPETKKIVISRDVNFNVPENKVQNAMDIFSMDNKAFNQILIQIQLIFPMMQMKVYRAMTMIQAIVLQAMKIVQIIRHQVAQMINQI